MKKVVIYTGDHCQPCRMLKSVLDSKGVQYESKDAKSNPDITSVPTIDFVDEDIVVERVVGSTGRTIVKIINWLK